MKGIIQRVQRARVEVDGEVVGQIGAGLLLLLGIHSDDQEGMVEPLLEKILQLRIHSDDAGKMNRSLLDIGGDLLIVSQFTLYADCSSGRRPSFTKAAPPEKARILYDRFVERAKEKLPTVQTGVFGASMQVHLINDGPVTFILEET